MASSNTRAARSPRRIFSEQLERGTVDLQHQATCVGCGCTDAEGCPEGCYWMAVDRRVGRGVCSCCPDQMANGWSSAP